MLPTSRVRNVLVGLMDPMFRYASSRLPDRESALDLVQEALAAALAADRAGRTWEHDEALWAWLIGTLRHKIADEYARRQRAVPSLSALGIHSDALAGNLSGGVAEKAAQRDEMSRVCRLAMNELAPRFYEVLHLYYHDGGSHRAIAEQLGLTEKAVESLLARARKALHDVFRRTLSQPEQLI